MNVTLRAYTQDPIAVIENAASNCYDSKPKTKGKIMEHCISSGHLSVCEFAQFHFHIEGVSRALLAQLTRHRTGKYAVRSQRYCSEDYFKYITPPSIESNEEVKEHYISVMKSLDWFYRYAQSKNIPKEDCRFVLPNACETTLDFSIDFRNLMHFMNERLCNRTQWEIRKLALEMKRCINEVEPALIKWLVPKCVVTGKCIESKSCNYITKQEDIKNE